MSRLRRPQTDNSTRPGNAEFLSHISYNPKRGAEPLLYDGWSLSDEELEQLGSCTVDDFRAMPELLHQIIAELVKWTVKDRRAEWVAREAAVIEGVRNRADKLGFRIKKLKRGEYPGRWDIIEHDHYTPWVRGSNSRVERQTIPGKRVASSLDAEGVAEWVKTEERRLEEEREERWRRSGYTNPFDAMFDAMLNRRSMIDRHHQVLGLNPDATADEIKRAYRKLARQFHPDVNPGREDRFREITEAYEAVLRWAE